MAETGEASDWLAPLAELDSYVFKMNFHKNAIHTYAGISNALHSVIKEKLKVQQERNVSSTARLQLIAANEELAKRNEEQAAEVQSLKRKLQASKARSTPGLQGIGCEHSQSGKQVEKRSIHKGKQQDEGHAGEDAEVTENLPGKNNLGQGVSTELRDVKDEIRNTTTKPTKWTYGRKAREEGPKDSSAVKVRRSSRLAAIMEEPEPVDIHVSEVSRTMAAALQDDASTAAPAAALHTIGQECGLSPDDLQAAMLLSSMFRC